LHRFKRFLGYALVIVGLTDNVWSWLTPLNAAAAAFDGLLILGGAYLIFKGSRS